MYYPILFMLAVIVMMFWRVALLFFIFSLFLMPCIKKELNKRRLLKESLDNMNLSKGEHIIIKYNNGKKRRFVYVEHDQSGVTVEYTKVKFGEIQSIRKEE